MLLLSRHNDDQRTRMTAVRAILCYSQSEPTFENSSHGQPPSVRSASSIPSENRTLFIVLPNHHIWAPHTTQRAVFPTSLRSRASTTLVVEHYCSKGCRKHPCSVDGIHAPLLRRVGDVPWKEGSGMRTLRQFTDRSPRVLPRRLSHLFHRGFPEVSETKPASISFM